MQNDLADIIIMIIDPSPYLRLYQRPICQL